MVDKDESYTKSISDVLMDTDNREAKVELMLVKFRVNQRGGMKEVAQSRSFRMDGTFREHEIEGFELLLNDSGDYIFITQNYDSSLNLDIRMWDSNTLREVTDEKVSRFRPKLEELSKARVNKFQEYLIENPEHNLPKDYQINMEMLFNNQYMAVSYFDFRHPKSYRERFVLYG
jgi:hypothetical protein